MKLINAKAKSSPAEARAARAVLTAMFGLAVEEEALERNLAWKTGARIKDPGRKAPRALDLESAQAVFALINAASSKKRPGRKSRKAFEDLRDVLLVQLGAGGLRVSEAAAIQAGDIDWTSTPPTLRVHQAVVYEPPMNGNPGCYLVQPCTKKSDIRIAPLAGFAVDILASRSFIGLGTDDLLFRTERGGPLNLNNLRRTLRGALAGTVFCWVSTHTMRRTVGTLVKRELGLAAASEVLGHKNEATTSAGYIEREVHTPDVTYLTQPFGELDTP